MAPPPDALTADGFVLEEDEEPQESVADFVFAEEHRAGLGATERARRRERLRLLAEAAASPDHPTLDFVAARAHAVRAGVVVHESSDQELEDDELAELEELPAAPFDVDRFLELEDVVP